ncbi:hypothetical protein B0J14DRAFT_611042 [Halenospora varia]|nr:hypothetical protein B0J14DRAFT_611042 [Halenospora varia]
MSYDWSAIQSALAGFSARAAAPRVKNNNAIKNILSHWCIPEDIANTVSKNELCYWHESEVQGVFARLDTTPAAIKRGLRSFETETSSADKSAMATRDNDFLKPNVGLMLQSVEKHAALCVNEAGEFSLRDTDYVAMSHVWIQGVGSDLDNRGLPHHLIRSIFARIRSMNVEWIWLDSLAIPGGVDALSLHEEELKASLINCLADVYRKAKAVVILDALLLRLRSVDPVETAALLCCGAWITRMWTYQEVKLAKHAIVVTKQGLVNWKDMVETLQKGAQIKSGEVQQDHRDKCSSLYRTLGRLQRNDKLGVSLPDLAYGCGYRQAGVHLDHARALFPTLGLTWKMNYNVEEAMKQVYLSQKEHATRVVLYHGPPRHHWPGWAPATFSDLIDGLILEESTWMRRGLKRRWFTVKVRRIVPSQPDALILALENADGTETLTGCRVSKKENPKSVAEFQQAVGDGTAYLLSSEALYPKKPFAFVGLLVERFKEAKELEAWVCMTVAVFDTEATYSGETATWLLLHENPVSHHHMSGKGFSELNYMIELSEQTEGSAEAGETPLHIAARTGNEPNFARLLRGMVDVNARDDRGWTPLHSAASAGQDKFIKLLAGAGANVNAFDREGRSALVLATDNGHLDSILALFEESADVNLSDPRAWSPLNTATMSRQVEALRLLLALGANPSSLDAAGWTALTFAVAGSGKDVLDALLEADADPAIPSSSGLTPLEGAARASNEYAIKQLIKYGANLNTVPPSGLTPLYFSIQE